MGKFLKKNIFVLAVLVALNVLSAFAYFRLDLTNDKRFTLAGATQELIKNLDDQVVIKVYLDGADLPSGFERLKRAIDQTLSEFSYYGGKNINYQFIDPYSGSEEEKKNLFKDLIAKGMQPTNVYHTKGGKKTENLVFPYATVWYKGKELTVLLLKFNQAEEKQNQLNQSYENVEFELASAIKKLSRTEKKKVGLLSEFTQLRPVNFAGLINSLQENYDLFIIDSKASPTFNGLDALIVPKPDRPIDDSTKFKIDQFVMNNGKVMFFIDGLKVDSIGLEGTFAQPLVINLDDLFFKYGVRINKNIVKDGLNAAVIPLVVGAMGDKPNIQPMLYRYFPLVNNFGNSLITKNLDMVYTKFTATMEVVNTKDGLKKTPLLLTSAYTKTLNAPALITYNEARTDTEQETYREGVKTLAYLIEGRFSSLYENRIHVNNAEILKKSGENKILICSDGDLILNDVDKKTGNPYPMGYDKFTNHQFGNQDFVNNALQYMLDQGGVLSAKSKEVKIRPLDSLKTRDSRTQWQVLNLALPLFLVLLAGSFRFWWVKRKYVKI
jgi:ABC-2 type transport system permease protein